MPRSVESGSSPTKSLYTQTVPPSNYLPSFLFETSIKTSRPLGSGMREAPRVYYHTAHQNVANPCKYSTGLHFRFCLSGIRGLHARPNAAHITVPIYCRLCLSTLNKSRNRDGSLVWMVDSPGSVPSHFRSLIPGHVASTGICKCLIDCPRRFKTSASG